MATHMEDDVRNQLATRRRKLEDAIASFPESSYLKDLMREVDGALSRLKLGTYGFCEICHDTIEHDRLAADPLTRFCLDHLTRPEQRALEQDLQLAARIQTGLLPKPDLAHLDWQTAYHYAPAGPVSGDYCDLVATEDRGLYFMLGDVSGKGVAASMLMAHLHAMFRTLIGVGLPLGQMIERASRLFCESTLAGHYATLVCGRAGGGGEIEICNAGHPSPLVVHEGEVRSIDATGLPLGMFCGERFSAERVILDKGDLLLLYTDGLSETLDVSGTEFGADRIAALVKQRRLPARELVGACVAAAAEFGAGSKQRDDVSIMTIERISEEGDFRVS